ELIVVNGGTPDALKRVSTGKADAYVGNLTVANYFIGRLGLNNLKVAAPTQFGDHTQAMAVRSDWPKLISILNKSLAQLSPQQRSEISRRWLSVKYEQGYSKQEMFGTAIIISAPLAFLLWLFYHWNQHLKTEIMLRNQLTTRLQDSEARFRELFQSMSSGVAIYEAVENGRNFIFKDMNQAGERISNVSRDKICGRLVTECFPGVDKPEFGLFQIFQQVYQDGQYRFHPLTFYTDEHHKLWVENKVFKLPSGEIVAVYDDVSARKHAEAEVRLYASVYENSGEAILITDANNKIIAINEAFTRLTGYHFHEVEGKDPKILASGKTTPATYQQLWQALQEKGYWQGQLWDQQRDGKIYPKWAAISVVHNEQGEISNYVASFTDISERIAAEQRIHQLAHNDTLTGLLNRFSLEEALQQILDQARQNNHSIALMFIDLDNFKNINDTLGHHLGDELLKAVAKRISNSVRHSDIVARLGGDEFIVVLSHLNDSQVTVNIANKIVSAVSALYQINGQELHTSPSIGISLYPTDGEYVEDLMQCADTAMYQAKSKGKCGYKFFAEEMTFVAQERMLLERELRHALSKNQLELYYQPQVSVTQQKLIGVEALIRWHHPLQGQIFPARFIPIAEESGLIQPLGRWILECACQQVAAWRQMGLPDFYVAVNISAHQLLSGDLFDLVKNTLAQYHIPPSQLELEITETVAMQNPEQAIQILEKLDKLGVSLTIDDFGTGYSSLAYLKRLPIHSLKLDQTFVRDIETDANDAAISSAT
ncbi:EAL domain-containing protein, partial [Candidatus Venteria ishoeyi]